MMPADRARQRLAEGLVFIRAHGRRQPVGAELAQILGINAIIITAAFDIGCGPAHPVSVVIEAKAQHMARLQGKIILHGGLQALSVYRRAGGDGRDRVQISAFIAALAKPEGQIPEIPRLERQGAADHPLPEVCLIPGRRENPAAKRERVEPGIARGLQDRQIKPHVVVELIAASQGKGEITVAIAIGGLSVRAARYCVYAAGVEIIHGAAVIKPVMAAAGPGSGPVGRLRAETRACGVAGRARALASKDLDDAADRVRTPHA